MAVKEITYTSIGRPVKAPFLIPVKHKSTPACINEPFWADGDFYKLTCVSFGTPHGVVLYDNLDDVDVAKVGEDLGTHPLFPEGANIVFVQIKDRTSIEARLWQRGEGEISHTTEAACAAMVASGMLQKVGNEVAVNMNGYQSCVKWKGGDSEVYFSAIGE